MEDEKDDLSPQSIPLSRLPSELKEEADKILILAVDDKQILWEIEGSKLTVKLYPCYETIHDKILTATLTAIINHFFEIEISSNFSDNKLIFSLRFEDFPLEKSQEMSFEINLTQNKDEYANYYFSLSSFFINNKSKIEKFNEVRSQVIKNYVKRKSDKTKLSIFESKLNFEKNLKENQCFITRLDDSKSCLIVFYKDNGIIKNSRIYLEKNTLSVSLEEFIKKLSSNEYIFLKPNPSDYDNQTTVPKLKEEKLLDIMEKLFYRKSFLESKEDKTEKFNESKNEIEKNRKKIIEDKKYLKSQFSNLSFLDRLPLELIKIINEMSKNEIVKLKANEKICFFDENKKQILWDFDKKFIVIRLAIKSDYCYANTLAATIQRFCKILNLPIFYKGVVFRLQCDDSTLEKLNKMPFTEINLSKYRNCPLFFSSFFQNNIDKTEEFNKVKSLVEKKYTERIKHGKLNLNKSNLKFEKILSKNEFTVIRSTTQQSALTIKYFDGEKVSSKRIYLKEDKLFPHDEISKLNLSSRTFVEPNPDELIIPTEEEILMLELLENHFLQPSQSQFLKFN